MANLDVACELSQLLEHVALKLDILSSVRPELVEGLPFFF